MEHPQTPPDYGADPLQNESTVCVNHLRLDDGVAAIERGFALFISPMATAAFAALQLLTQLGNL